MQDDSRVRLGRGASMRGKAESGGFLSYDAMKIFFMGDGERGRFAAGVGRDSRVKQLQVHCVSQPPFDRSY
jgi:hypothetical protein